jgi:hypothetical protein
MNEPISIMAALIRDAAGRRAAGAQARHGGVARRARER